MFKASIFGDVKKMNLSALLLLPEKYNGTQNRGYDFPFELEEIKKEKFAYVIILEDSFDELSIDKIFLTYDQAYKYNWIITIFNRVHSMEINFQQSNSNEKQVRQNMEIIKGIELKAKQLNIELPPMKEILSGNKKYSYETFDTEKIVYELGNKKYILDDGYFDNRTSTKIVPVPIVLPMLNDEIHPHANNLQDFWSLIK